MEPQLDEGSILPILPPIPNPNPNLLPSNPAASRREERHRRKERKQQEKLQAQLALWDPLSTSPLPSDRPSPPPSDAPWPCLPAPSDGASSAAWGPLSAAPTKPPPSTEEWVAAIEAQANALTASRAFFAENYFSDDDGSMDDEEGDDKERQSSAFAFFSDLFKKDGDLRVYYETGREKGEFFCLACEWGGKPFVGWTAIVQHASSISNTRRKRAHRALGRVVCCLFGYGTRKLDSNNGGSLAPVALGVSADDTDT